MEKREQESKPKLFNLPENNLMSCLLITYYQRILTQILLARDELYYPGSRKYEQMVSRIFRNQEIFLNPYIAGLLEIMSVHDYYTCENDAYLVLKPQSALQSSLSENQSGFLKIGFNADLIPYIQEILNPKYFQSNGQTGSLLELRKKNSETRFFLELEVTSKLLKEPTNHKNTTLPFDPQTTADPTLIDEINLISTSRVCYVKVANVTDSLQSTRTNNPLSGICIKLMGNRNQVLAQLQTPTKILSFLRILQTQPNIQREYYYRPTLNPTFRNDSEADLNIKQEDLVKPMCLVFNQNLIIYTIYKIYESLGFTTNT